MDKTNYAVLSMVAVVAIVAVVSIFLHAKASNGFTPLGEGLSITGNTIANVFSVEITGQVTAGSAPRATATRDPLDFDGDGSLTRDDATLLSAVIDRVEFCPRNTRCDVNEDGFVDLSDLGALNSKILQAEVAHAKSTAYVPTPQRTATTADPALSVGTFGAIA